jgi:hypothetical protein
MRQEPELHKSFPMQTWVQIRGMNPTLDGRGGKIIGISNLGIIHLYIVKLDEPYFDQ